MGCAADVFGRNFLSDPDKIHGHKGLRSQELAAPWPDKFSAGSAGSRGRNHGPGIISQPVSADASDAEIALVRSDCWRALSSDFDAARPRRMHHLGPGVIG